MSQLLGWLIFIYKRIYITLCYVNRLEINPR